MSSSPPEPLEAVMVAASSNWRGPRYFFAIALTASIAVAGCATSTIIDPAVAPVVQRVETAPAPLQWQFNYRPDSASPYIACLDGIDEVTGTIDLTTSAMTLQPNRAAPLILVTDSSFMVAAEPDGTGTWDEVQWGPDDDQGRLVAIFGEVLAGYIGTGLRAPDPNMTTLAAVDIAAEVFPATPLSGFVGDTFGVTLDPDRYLDEVSANDATIAEDEQERIPTLTVTVDENGRVVALIVDTTSGRDLAADHDRYVITTSYNVALVDVPESTQRRPASLTSISYPTPATSCQFGS